MTSCDDGVTRYRAKGSGVANIKDVNELFNEFFGVDESLEPACVTPADMDSEEKASASSDETDNSTAPFNMDG